MGADLLSIRANLEVDNVPASIDFYRRVFGMEPVVTMGEPPTFAILAGGATSLGICAAAAPAVAGIAAVYVDVADVEAAHARCQVEGVELTAPLTTHPWGMRDFVVRDPDGHQLAVGQRVA